MTAAAKTKAKTDAAKRMKKSRANSRPTPLDFGTPELQRLHKIGAVETDRAGQFAGKVLDQRRVDWMHDKSVIYDRQWTAAEKLLKDFHASGLQKSTTQPYDGSGGGSKARKHGARPTEPVPSTRPMQAFVSALRSLGYRRARLVRYVVIDDRPAGQAARWCNFAEHPNSAVYDALDYLADHYHKSGVSGFEKSVV